MRAEQRMGRARGVWAVASDSVSLLSRACVSLCNPQAVTVHSNVVGQCCSTCLYDGVSEKSESLARLAD